MEKKLGSPPPTPVSSTDHLCLPLYWRSRLLIDTLDPSVFLHSMNTQDAPIFEVASSLEVVFVDATISFQVQLRNNNDDKEDNKKQSIACPISIAFGALVRHSSSSCTTKTNEFYYYYLRGPPVTQSFLRDHVDQHDTVLEETKSYVIANHMSLALQQLQQNVRVQVKFQNQQQVKDQESNSIPRLQQVDIPLLYDNGCETSLLHLVDDSGTGIRPLDHHVASTWLCSMIASPLGGTGNATSNDGTSSVAVNPTTSKDDAKQIWNAYQDWNGRGKECLQDEAARRVAGSQDFFFQTNATNDSVLSSPAKDVHCTTSSNYTGATTTTTTTTTLSSSPSPNTDIKIKPPKKKFVGPRGVTKIGGFTKKTKTKFKFGSMMTK